MDEFPETVLDTRAILEEVKEWRLPLTEWTELSELIESIAEALSAADASTLGRLIDELVLHTPERAIPLGADRVVPMPPPLRERVNQLVHTLGGQPASKVVQTKR